MVSTNAECDQCATNVRPQSDQLWGGKIEETPVEVVLRGFLSTQSRNLGVLCDKVSI